MVDMIYKAIIVGFTFFIAALILLITILCMSIVIKIFTTKDGKWFL